jgi:hypothetical protein
MRGIKIYIQKLQLVLAIEFIFTNQLLPNDKISKILITNECFWKLLLTITLLKIL